MNESISPQRYIKKKFSYWTVRGLSGPQPVPIFGTFWKRLIHDPKVIELGWFKKYGKVYGSYMGFEPVLTVAEPELIKQVMIKDFAYFINRRALNTQHEMMNRSMFTLDDDDWKQLRFMTSPSFTLIKLKGMQPLMNECVRKLDTYLAKITEGGSEQGKKVEISAKTVLAGFTIDVIVSTAFGSEVSTNGNDRYDALIQNCMEFFQINPVRALFCLTMPVWVNTLVGFKSMFAEKNCSFLAGLLKGIMLNRRSNKVVRNDFIQSLMNAEMDEAELAKTEYSSLAFSEGELQLRIKTVLLFFEKSILPTESSEVSASEQTHLAKGSNVPKRRLTENEVVAQSVLYFNAGYETSGATLSYFFYEMAKHLTIQDRLVNEINAALASVDPDDEEKRNDIILNDIPYLDACIKETLRKYPPIIRLERRLNKDGYELGGIKLNRGIMVEIPSQVVHYNPEYYPDPEKFDPERFMPENKDKLVPYTYLAFGLGPRNCVGTRFAYQQIKFCLANILPKYKLTPSARTPERVSFVPSPFLLLSFDVHVNLERR